MKALTIINPWAWAIVNLDPPHAKDIENRDWYWPSMIGKRFAIHVGKSNYDDIAEEGLIRRGIMREKDRELAQQQRGFIIGVATLARVVTRSQSPWFEGRFGLVLADVFRLPHMVQARGAQLFWNLSPEIEVAVRMQIKHAAHTSTNV